MAAMFSAGLVIVISFIGLWVFLRIAQVLFGKQAKLVSDLGGDSTKPGRHQFVRGCV
jgi:hypothetical protein